MDIQKSKVCSNRDRAECDSIDPGGRVVSNIFDDYLPKLIARIETDEFVWEMWDL